jgi:hypothetical protein
LHRLPSLLPKEQAAFETSLLGFIDQSNPDQLIEVMNTVKEYVSILAGQEKFLKRAQDRTQAHFANHKVRIAFFQLANEANKRNAIHDLLLNTWNQLDQSQAALTEATEFLSPEEFSSTILSLIQKYDGLGEGLFERALTHLGSYLHHYTVSFLKNLTEELFNDWFKKPSVQARRGAQQLWIKIRNQAKDFQNVFYSRLLDQATRSASDDTIIQPANKIIVDVLLNDHDCLSDKQAEAIVYLGLQMTERARPLPVQLYGFEILGKLAIDPFAQKKVPEELISDLEHEGQHELIRASLNTLKVYEDSISKNGRAKLRKILKTRSEETVFQEFKNKF